MCKSKSVNTIFTGDRSPPLSPAEHLNELFSCILKYGVLLPCLFELGGYVKLSCTKAM